MIRDDIATLGYANLVAIRLAGKFDFSVHGDGDDWFCVRRRTFKVMSGRKYDRIVHSSWLHGNGPYDSQESVFCFVDKEGNVYKAEGWKKPAKGVRYNVSTPAGFQEFIEAADPYGSFLYAGNKK